MIPAHHHHHRNHQPVIITETSSLFGTSSVCLTSYLAHSHGVCIHRLRFSHLHHDREPMLCCWFAAYLRRPVFERLTSSSCGPATMAPCDYMHFICVRVCMCVCFVPKCLGQRQICVFNLWWYFFLFVRLCLTSPALETHVEILAL